MARFTFFVHRPLSEVSYSWSPLRHVSSVRARTQLSRVHTTQGPALCGPAMNLQNENLQRTKEHQVERPRGDRPALSISLAFSSRQASRVWDFPCLLPLPTATPYCAPQGIQRDLAGPGYALLVGCTKPCPEVKRCRIAFHHGHRRRRGP